MAVIRPRPAEVSQGLTNRKKESWDPGKSDDGMGKSPSDGTLPPRQLSSDNYTIYSSKSFTERCPEQTWFHWFTGAENAAEFFEWDTWREMSTHEKITHVKNEIALGITICFAQIPESAAFAFMGHVKPTVAIHATWVVGLICSIFGGRTGLVSGAEGAFAHIIATFVEEPTKHGGNGEGIELLFPSVMMCGVFMLIVWRTGLYKFVSLVPAPVMVGFCNGLAIEIANSQVHHFKTGHGFGKQWKSGDELWWMFLEMLVAMCVMEALPKLPSAVSSWLPSSLVAILLAVALEFAVVRPVGGRTDTIGDTEKFHFSYPYPFFLHDDYDMGVLQLSDVPYILLHGGLLATAGTMQGLLTCEVVEDFIKTPTHEPADCLAGGVANIVSGFLGGMGGDAAVGLSTLNCLNGGRGRLGPAITAVGIMLCMFFAYPLLNIIPMAALAGVMAVVVVHTFKWFSIPLFISALLPERMRKDLHLPERVDRFDVLVIVVTTFVVVTANLVYGVALGMLLAGLRYAWDSSQDFEVESIVVDDTKVYFVKGRLFFATAMHFHACFDYENDPDKVVIFLEYGPTDSSACAGLGKVETHYIQAGKEVTIQRCAKSRSKAGPDDEPQVTSQDVQNALHECRQLATEQVKEVVGPLKPRRPSSTSARSKLHSFHDGRGNGNGSGAAAAMTAMRIASSQALGLGGASGKDLETVGADGVVPGTGGGLPTSRGAGGAGSFSRCCLFM